MLKWLKLIPLAFDVAKLIEAQAPSQESKGELEHTPAVCMRNTPGRASAAAASHGFRAAVAFGYTQLAATAVTSPNGSPRSNPPGLSARPTGIPGYEGARSTSAGRSGAGCAGVP
jgi:hypothetical protein